MRIYLAGPLFTQAERRFLAALRDDLGALPGVCALWPGDFFTDVDLVALGAAAKYHIFRGCLDGLTGSDLVVAWLDGPQVDDGTSWELGHAHALGIPAWGLRTDFRRAGDTTHSLVNCMIECSCERIFHETGALLAAVGRRACEGVAPAGAVAG